MANDLTFKQVSTILNDIMQQATGQTSIAPVDTHEFVTMGQKALLIGYDPLATAISQVLAQTIFSIRPYTEHFKGLRVSNQKYGNHVRKLNVVDKDFVNDDQFSLVDGQSIDHYIVRKPEVVQTNFYGMEGYSDYITIYTDQLDNAFSGPSEFASFITMIMQNITDKQTQARENMSRMTLANMIGAKAIADSTSVINLLAEYNTYTGSNFTATTIKAPANYESFIKWAYARIRNISDMMTERSAKFHTAIGTDVIMRHTPYDRQKLYLSSFDAQQVDARVLSGTFNPDRLKLMDYEAVNFWQNIDAPAQISVKPSYLNASGNTTSGSSVVVSEIFGVLFDEEACGYTIINERTERTPLNARGLYYNQFWHDNKKYWNDLSENMVVFTLANPVVTSGE